MSGTMLGRYEVLKCLARGATTDLLLARARGMAGFERHVVIKRIHDSQALDDKFVQTFMTEARLAAALHHNNIVQVQDIGQDGDAPYFAMEYVHGEDVRTILAHLTKRRERLPLEHTLTICMQAASALHYAHESTGPDGKPLAIVHRDVTPSNIIVGYDGNVKVGDFGIAKAAITIPTQVGQLKGRAPYMAPEQCEGKTVDRRSDVFALGIVMWEMATMQRLFKGKTDHETMKAIVFGDVPRPSKIRDDLPLGFETIVMKALAKAPADRYESAHELARALDAFASELELTSSTSALATYIGQHVGPRPEPWLIEGSGPVRAATAVDFDTEEATDTSDPPEAVIAAQAAGVKLGPSPAVIEKRLPPPKVAPAFASSGAKPPRPIVAPLPNLLAQLNRAEPAAENTTAQTSIVVAEEVGAPEPSNDLDSVAGEVTLVDDPPALPAAPARGEQTEHVRPLTVAERTSTKVRKARRVNVAFMVVGGGVIALAIAIVIGFDMFGSGHAATRPPVPVAAPESAPVTTPVAPEPVPVAAPEPVPVAAPVTPSAIPTSDVAATAATAAGGSSDVEPAVASEPPPVTNPPIAKPAIAKPAIAKPAPKAPVIAKVAPAKPAPVKSAPVKKKPLKYDPNSLFLKTN